MEFSLFNLGTLPQNGVSHADVFRQIRTMVKMADEGGFDIAWFAEHHLSNYSILPSPLIMVAHMAGQTKQIKLGPAVVVLPFYEPLRLVEDIFLTDHLSEGRFVLGLGTGYQPREFEKFGFDISSRLERGLEMWDVICQAQDTNYVDFAGEHINIKDAALSIAPYQKPIPIYAVGNAPEFRRRIIERHATALCTPGVQPPTMMGTLRRLLSETCHELGVADEVPFGVQRYIYVTEDKNEARMAAQQVLAQARMATNMRNEKPDMNGTFLNLPPFENEPDIDTILNDSPIGSTEKVAEQIIEDARAYRITHLSVFMQIAAIPYELALNSLERFIDQVMPVVKTELGSDRNTLRATA